MLQIFPMNVCLKGKSIQKPQKLYSFSNCLEKIDPNVQMLASKPDLWFVHTYTYTYTFWCMYMYMYLKIGFWIYVHICTYIKKYMYSDRIKCMYTYICISKIEENFRFLANFKQIFAQNWRVYCGFFQWSISFKSNERLLFSIQTRKISFNI